MDIGKSERYSASKGTLHRSALLECEARRIARTLADYGILEQHQLLDLARARSWESGSFRRACDLAVEMGLIRRLGFGFYRALRPPEGPTFDSGEVRSAQLARRRLESGAGDGV